MRISFWTSNIKYQDWGETVETPTQDMEQQSFTKEQLAQKWLWILSDNSAQFPIKKHPAEAISCVNFILTSPELYFLFDPHGNWKKQLNGGRRGESNKQKLYSLSTFETPNWQPAMWTSPFVSSLPSTSYSVIRSSWILKPSTALPKVKRLWMFGTSTENK